MTASDPLTISVLSPDCVLTDTHCHLDMNPYAGRIDAVLAEAAQLRVSRIITIGVDLASSQAALQLATTHQAIYASVGFHPHEAKIATSQALQQVAALTEQSGKIVAYGEIGLDYVKKHSPPELQRKAFSNQLALAKELNLPVIIHDREAHADTMRLIREAGPLPKGGVMHCFSGDVKLAQAMIDLGFLLSIPGVVTFPSATMLHEVARRIPLKHLLLETDGPFLAPVPHRGKPNHPAYLIHTAQRVAELQAQPLERVMQQTSANAAKLFGFAEAEV